MQIAMQIAQQNKDSDPKKAATFAQKAYDLASLLSNAQIQAQSSWLGAEAYMAQRNYTQAKAKFERCERHAASYGDFVLASDCYRQLISNAQRENDYKEAAKYGLFAADLLKKKGGATKPITQPSNSNSSNDNARWQMLSKENERLQQENGQLRQQIQSNPNLEQKLGGEKAKFADVQRQLERQKQKSKMSNRKSMQRKMKSIICLPNKPKSNFWQNVVSWLFLV